MAEEGRGDLRASYADREQAIEMLKAAFTQERLAKDEFEVRVGQAFAARTHAQLAVVTADIPAPPIPDQPPSTSRVREQRTRREISQAELAEALGVSRQTVISIENGHYLPSLPLAFAIAIARFFDLTVDKMFGPAEEEAGAPPRGKQAGACNVSALSPGTHGMSVGQHKPMLPHTARMSSAPCLVPIWSNAAGFPNRL
jgi:putative transcriptional regulator